MWYGVRHKIRNYSLNKTVDVMCYLSSIGNVCFTRIISYYFMSYIIPPYCSGKMYYNKKNRLKIVFSKFYVKVGVIFWFIYKYKPRNLCEDWDSNPHWFCPHCKCESRGKSLTTAQVLKKHIHTIHEDHKDYECDSCGRS